MNQKACENCDVCAMDGNSHIGFSCGITSHLIPISWIPNCKHANHGKFTHDPEAENCGPFKVFHKWHHYYVENIRYYINEGDYYDIRSY